MNLEEIVSSPIMRNEQAEEELSHVLKNNSFTWKHYGKKLSAGWNWKKAYGAADVCSLSG